MTPSELSAIRARLDAATPENWAAEISDHAVFIKASKQEANLIATAPTDLRALLYEVERLTVERDEAMRWRDEWEAFKAYVSEVQQAAFRRGANAMREAAAQACEVSPIHGQKTTTARRYADAIRALPISEDKS